MQYPQILDVCITHLQDGTLTYEACLAQYPLYADQLQRDLSIFQITQNITKPTLESSAVESLEARLLRQFNPTNGAEPDPKVIPLKQPTRAQRLVMPYMKLVAGLAIMFMLLVGAGGGTVMASANSLPGDNLYVVKVAWEQVILFVASLVNQLDDVWLSLTQTRANEIIELQQAGRLTSDVLNTFYITAENAILYATDDTEQAYIIFANDFRDSLSQAMLISTDEAQQFRILRVLSPEMDENGNLTLPGGENFLPQSDEPIVATATPTIQPTATFTPTATETATATFTVSPTFEPTATRTPTPSRTPTLLPSATFTLTTTLQPTATWTPLGIQPRGEGVTVDTDTGDSSTGSVKPTKPTFIGENEFFVRQTEQAVQITQTTIAQTPTPTETTP